MGTRSLISARVAFTRDSDLLSAQLDSSQHLWAIRVFDRSSSTWKPTRVAVPAGRSTGAKGLLGADGDDVVFVEDARDGIVLRWYHLQNLLQ